MREIFRYPNEIISVRKARGGAPRRPDAAARRRYQPLPLSTERGDGDPFLCGTPKSNACAMATERSSR